MESKNLWAPWRIKYIQDLGESSPDKGCFICHNVENPQDDDKNLVLLEMIKLVRDSQKALSLAIKPHGFNVGMNFGRCAGAGLPDHLHIHIVPRWDGDTNFMHVCSDTDVISQSMLELFDELKKVSKKINLPSCL